MNIALMVLEFHLSGCRSLKEKRGRLRGLRDRFGRIANLAVAETEHQNRHDAAQWTFVAISEDKGQCEKLLASVEEHASRELDAVVSHVHREWL